MPGARDEGLFDDALEGDDRARTSPPPHTSPSRPPTRRYRRPTTHSAAPGPAVAPSPDSIAAGVRRMSVDVPLPSGPGTWSAAQLEASRVGWRISAKDAHALGFLAPAVVIQGFVRRRAARRGLPPAPPRTAVPSPCIGGEANRQAAEEWLSKAKARHEAGEDDAAARFCDKSLALLETDAARDFADHLREFGAGSAAAKVAARVLAAADDRSVLEVGYGATAEEVKKAYKRLALQLHPDRNRAREAEAAFKRLLEAYTTLTAAGRRPRPTVPRYRAPARHATGTRDERWGTRDERWGTRSDERW